MLRALNHPIRRRILRALVDGAGSATTISQKTGMDLSLVSYHLSQVLAKECDIVELVDTVPRRGAVEKFYRLKFHALSEADPGEEGAARLSPRRMSFEECFIVAVSAMDADALAEREGSSWDWSLAEVDAVAWDEIRAASEEFNARTRQAAEESRRRAGGEASSVVVGVAAFPAIASPAPTQSF
ncbi:MAG TPA: helix-turn-helix domain-containing protein [Solirubrobacterales bacterium]|nr:helix-turn-helix domain-containing protein [Solirubrobacterales bacterium]